MGSQFPYEFSEEKREFIQGWICPLLEQRTPDFRNRIPLPYPLGHPQAEP